MDRLGRRASGAVLGALLVVGATAGPGTAQTAGPGGTAAATNVADGKASSLVMVLDSSGSMADDDGSGQSRITSARKAVGTVVDALPDGHPTGLRLYGADRNKGCTDTRLAEPVAPLDRDGLKKAVAKVRPKGDTPIGLSLRKAAQDLPEAPSGTIGKRTVLLISDGEDNCNAPPPCEAAEELAENGVDLRIDVIGFQVGGTARKQLSCVAEKGKGSYYDAPDADALARQLQRAARTSADAYRLDGKRLTGGLDRDKAARLDAGSGQYVDTIGPRETRWYRVEMDEKSTNSLSVTGVPNSGMDISRSDGLRLQIYGPGKKAHCKRVTRTMGQDEGAAPLVAAAHRVPDDVQTSGSCDRGAGEYLVSVERRAGVRVGGEGRDSDWPIELAYTVEAPLGDGVQPAGAQTELGAAAGPQARLPQAQPKKVRGGTGFNDARKVTSGVWRDTLVPAQTRWYRVPAGWGQQVRYDVEFSNEPTVEGHSSERSRIATDLYSPNRFPIDNDSALDGSGRYDGRPARLSAGTVPVSWANRYESDKQVRAVNTDGEYYLAVTLGPDAAKIAENPEIGIVLRLDVKGKAKSGPQHEAAADTSNAAGDDSAADDGGRGRGTVAAVAGGAGAVLLGGLGAWYLLARRRTRNVGPTNGDFR
ncbi:vWA domain-containing protein [Streptomyces xiaopingdaonensis]|uniref:vWA domain-containing protein n=1 Tax=Streptomyces xiaopingdaonensis TaxID=1565415 RepID=UPI00035EE0C3|nr:VWA domain-containing protein [Streptomyces xiaopingdaonensis]